MFDYTPAREIEIVSNPVNGIEHPVLQILKNREKEDFVLWSKYLKREERWKISGVGYSHLYNFPHQCVHYGSLRGPSPHSQIVVLAILYLFVCL